MERVILITGANGGIGLAIAQAFLDESPQNHVWMGVRARRDKTDALTMANPERCHPIQLEVSEPEAWDRCVKEILRVHKRLDVLVNNAGGPADDLLAMMTLEKWRKVLSSNLDSVFLGCHAVLPTMIGQRRGRIVNIASLSALIPAAGQANYAAAKAGVVALTQSLAKEVARAGVTVNVVCPGYIDTPALDHMSPEEKDRAKARVPMRRFGTPGEVAATVRFLACHEAAYITGSVIKIDGGIL